MVLIIKKNFSTRTNDFKSDIFRFRKEIGKKRFTNKVVEDWNKLSDHVVSEGTVDTFEKRFDMSLDDENRW